jgi:hypothetical protein
VKNTETILFSNDENKIKTATANAEEATALHDNDSK